MYLNARLEQRWRIASRWIRRIFKARAFLFLFPLHFPFHFYSSFPFLFLSIFPSFSFVFSMVTSAMHFGPLKIPEGKNEREIKMTQTKRFAWTALDIFAWSTKIIKGNGRDCLNKGHENSACHLQVTDWGTPKWGGVEVMWIPNWCSVNSMSNRRAQTTQKNFDFFIPLRRSLRSDEERQKKRRKGLNEVHNWDSRTIQHISQAQTAQKQFSILFRNKKWGYSYCNHTTTLPSPSKRCCLMTHTERYSMIISSSGRTSAISDLMHRRLLSGWRPINRLSYCMDI